MKKSEFMNMIDDAEVGIERGYCVCPMIADRDTHASRRARKEFQKLFAPKGIDVAARYFGPPNGFNIPVRLTALFIFKEHCLTSGVFRKF